MSKAEQQAFEQFVEENKLPTQQHPLHYLFLDPATNAARRAWRAALDFSERLLKRTEVDDGLSSFLFEVVTPREGGGTCSTEIHMNGGNVVEAAFNLGKTQGPEAKVYFIRETTGEYWNTRDV